MISENNSKKTIFIIEMILTGCFLLLGILVLVLGSALKSVNTSQSEKVAAVEKTAKAEGEEATDSPQATTEGKEGTAASNKEASDVLPAQEIGQNQKTIFSSGSVINLQSGTLQQNGDGSILYRNNSIGYTVTLPQASYIGYSEQSDLIGIQLTIDDNDFVSVEAGYSNYGQGSGFYDNTEATETGHEYYCVQYYNNAYIAFWVVYSDYNADKYGSNSAFCEYCRNALTAAQFDFDIYALPGDPASDWEAEYMLPYSDTSYITESDLFGFGQWECKIARNEIYARHGRLFKDAELQAYFNSCSWYEGHIAPDDFPETLISEVERANINTIVNYEKKMGYR